MPSKTLTAGAIYRNQKTIQTIYPHYSGVVALGAQTQVHTSTHKSGFKKPGMRYAWQAWFKKFTK